jgi:predicted lipid-binding transport protein (Tim44 family)
MLKKMSSFAYYKIILLMYIYQIMSNNFGYIDIILLGMIAGFIILRLRNILGRKTGHETKIYPNFAEKKFNIPKNNVKSFKKNHDILEGDEKKEFLKGAEIAYESILTSFANGESKKLKSLLTSQMADNFNEAIEARNKQNIKSEFTFIGIKESSVEKYEKIKNDLFTSVKFVSEVISVKKNNEDQIIEGNPDKIKQVTDYWKFTRNVLNKSPNWYLSEIVSK